MAYMIDCDFSGAGAGILMENAPADGPYQSKSFTLNEHGRAPALRASARLWRDPSTSPMIPAAAPESNTRKVKKRAKFRLIGKM